MTWGDGQPSLGQDDLLLDQLGPSDAEDVFQACQDPLIQHFTQVPVPYAREHAEAFIADRTQAWRTVQMVAFAVRIAHSRQLLGVVSILEVDWAARSGEVGYWTAPWGRGRGFTTRAVTLATDWALAAGGLHRLTAEAERANTASCRVLVKAGFHEVPGERVIELKGSARTMVAWEKATG